MRPGRRHIRDLERLVTGFADRGGEQGVVCFRGIARLVEGQFGFGHRNFREADVQAWISGCSARELAPAAKLCAACRPSPVRLSAQHRPPERSVIGLINLQ